MPFKGFLGPSWEPVALTRILRHYPLQYSTLFMNIQAVIHKERRQRRKTEVFFFHMGAKKPPVIMTGGYEIDYSSTAGSSSSAAVSSARMERLMRLFSASMSMILASTS